jgi:hypothetical protein
VSQKRAKFARKVANKAINQKGSALNDAFVHAMFRSPLKVRWAISWRLVLGLLPEHLRRLDEEAKP